MVREQWGPHEVWVDEVHERGTSEHRRSRGKGASLLHMIPLERWNVERSCSSGGKVTKTRLPIPLFTPSNRLVERGAVAYVPHCLERRHHNGYSCGHGQPTCWR